MEINEIKQMFNGRNQFAIIGLTGRTGSGCTTAASILTQSVPEFPTYHDTKVDSNPFYNGLNGKRYNVVKKYAQHNWHSFFQIKVSDVIGAFFVKIEKKNLIDFIFSNKRESKLTKAKISKFLDGGYYASTTLWDKHSELINHIIDGCALKSDYDLKQIIEFSHDIGRFNRAFKKDLNRLCGGLYVSVYQEAGDSIRKLGYLEPEFHKAKFKLNPEAIFKLPEAINRSIKIYRDKCKAENKPAYIVIDAIRNPLEARFFKDRYSAFYLISINASDEDRRKYLKSVYKYTEDQLENLDRKESGKAIQEKRLSDEDKQDSKKVADFKRSKREAEWISQNVKRCIELSDIHLYNPKREPDNNNVLAAQLAWYFALIVHPGLASPTSMERVMQIAYTAKANSGCISRQVGAVITDKNYSIKAVGWNDVAEGQYPCSLRSVEGVLHEFDNEIYSYYEQNDADFRKGINKVFQKVIVSDKNRKTLHGRTLSYCFKDIRNDVSNEYNQVHTRSLHAEENAFLQITKYGGQSIEGGKLFTTASPCELCAKKAYQLGIKEIIYIDPYPGIARDHILNIGKNKPELFQFRGAVGKAYHMLYEPVMSFKDELEYFL